MMAEVPPLPRAIVEALDYSFAFADLEVDRQQDQIFRAGLVRGMFHHDYWHGDVRAAVERLEEWRKTIGIGLCGHNFLRFDYPHLVRGFPDFGRYPIIDTLELSVLAFPLQTTHRLDKDYKLSEYAGNDPVADALKARQLLLNTLAVLRLLPQALLRLYAWLLACGTTAADGGYRLLFDGILGVDLRAAPSLDTLPEPARRGLNRTSLTQALRTSPTLSFDARLCLAGLIAWNYAGSTTADAGDQAGSERIYSGWLAHLPDFRDVLDKIRPIPTAIPDYALYLGEFGIERFRSPQGEAIEALVRGQRPLIIMPTGGGKSLCYQLPAYALWREHRSLTIVISPLQALMEDQVADLENQGLTFSTFINANLPLPERQQRLEQLRLGEKGLLYIGPEQLRAISIRSLLHGRSPVLWIIDEAHCISQWGHDFRPDYRYLPKFISELYRDVGLPLPLIGLVTATATMAVAEDIRAVFAAHGLPIGAVIRSTTSRRDNLTFAVERVGENKLQALATAAQKAQVHKGAMLVYTSTRKGAEGLAAVLSSAGIPSRYYHGKLERDQKRDVLDLFKSRRLNAVAATSAFGMGINRPDVRAVIHYSMSANLEGYVQEAGRAGRDGGLASCTLLYDPNDADTIFFLQGHHRLGEGDLRNILGAVKSFRKRVYGDTATDAWFWVTTAELAMEAALGTDPDPGREQEQRDTKVKVALHHLEDFGLVERAENLSMYLRLKLVQPDAQSAQTRFATYAANLRLSAFQVAQFAKLIDALYFIHDHWQDFDEHFPLDTLADGTGIEPRDLVGRLRELERAGICRAEVAVVILLNKGVRGDARRNLERVREVERDLLRLLREVQADGADAVQVSLRGAASRLDSDARRGIRAAALRLLLEEWAARSWVHMTRVGRDVVKLTQITVDEQLERHTQLTDAVMEVLYESAGARTGARLRLHFELGSLLESVNRRLHPATVTPEDLDAVLLWLHHQRIIRLDEGLGFFQQALRVRVTAGGSVRMISARYPEVQAHYDAQTRRTHIMLAYGQLGDEDARLRFIDEYFALPRDEFERRYPDLAGEAIARPVSPEEYERIMGPLSPTQRIIVEANATALAIIAGPGAGKTRTIVHKIAYLVKVKHVDPSRILALAYNRNAVRELRLRLQDLVGARAASIHVQTFHGLALSLLGRTITGERSSELNLTQLLVDAVAMIEHGIDELDDDDTEARRTRVLGGVEYIFVDEYQDVDEDMYRLIRAVAGWGQSEDESRSVQINLCIIGDDDQAIYEFRGASPEYIRRFEQEYQAGRLLLTENYRSTQPIITAANQLIQHAQVRTKRATNEQVTINAARRDRYGAPVLALRFDGPQGSAMLATWVSSQVQRWLTEGVPPGEIAVLARTWNDLGPVRLLLERAGVSSQALGQNAMPKLVRRLATWQMMEELRRAHDRVFGPEESVVLWFEGTLAASGHTRQEPTVCTLLRIAEAIDQERGWLAGHPVGEVLDLENITLPIGVDEILTTLVEFDEAGQPFREGDMVLMGTCHSAKGLEFGRVILLTDGFHTHVDAIESERRLFYVAMTRAKDELVLCMTRPHQLVAETGLAPVTRTVPATDLPAQMLYLDMDPGDMYLGHPKTIANQHLIRQLKEGDRLHLRPNLLRNTWDITTEQGLEIGGLSKAAIQELASKGMRPGHYSFGPDDVRLGSIYRQLAVDEVTGEITRAWFVPLPQLHLCR